MPDMSEILRQRAAERLEANVDLDQSFEARKARALEGLTRQLKPRIDMLRLIGPPKPQMAEVHRQFARDEASSGMAYCRFCNPPAEEIKCVLCDREFAERWELGLHTALEPKYCKDRYDRKVRTWARQA